MESDLRLGQQVVDRARRRERRRIPLDRPFQSLPYPPRRAVAEKPLCLVDVGLRQAHIPGARCAMDRARPAQVGKTGFEQRTDYLEQLVESRLLVQRDVVDL